MYMLGNMRLGRWCPTPRDVEILRRWLFCPFASTEHKLARRLLLETNWPGETSQIAGVRRAPVGLQRSVAIIVTDHFAQRQSELARSSVLNQLVSKADIRNLQSWSWQMLFKLQLRGPEPMYSEVHKGELLSLQQVRALLSLGRTTAILVLAACELTSGALPRPQSERQASAHALSIYTQLMITEVGYVDSAIKAKGLSQVLLMIPFCSDDLQPVLSVLFHMLPCLVANRGNIQQGAVVVGNILQVALAASRRISATEEDAILPFCAMLHSQLLGEDGAATVQSERLALAELWLRAVLSVQDWVDDTGLRSLAGVVCGVAFSTAGGRSLVQTLLKMSLDLVLDSGATPKPKGLLSAVTSLFRTSIGPSLSFGSSGGLAICLSACRLCWAPPQFTLCLAPGSAW